MDERVENAITADNTRRDNVNTVEKENPEKQKMESPMKATRLDTNEDAEEIKQLVMISSCISEMSNKYELTCRSMQNKLDNLETTSKHLNMKFEQLQRDHRNINNSNLPT